MKERSYYIAAYRDQRIIRLVEQHIIRLVGFDITAPEYERWLAEKEAHTFERLRRKQKRTAPRL